MHNVMTVMYGREKRCQGANWKSLEIDFCDCLLVRMFYSRKDFFNPLCTITPMSFKEGYVKVH